MILRAVYGAYTYYGGDEVFVPIFERMKETLRTQEIWNTQRHGDFTELVHYNLSQVISDNHFVICLRQLVATGYIVSGSVTPPRGATADFFYSGTAFDRSENGFRSKETGLYVISASKHDLEDLFRLSIDPHGIFSYIPIVMIKGRSNKNYYPLELTFENDHHETIVLHRHIPIMSGFQRQPSMSRINDVPVITIMFMGMYPNGEDAQAFLGFVEKLRDEPIIIIDLRSNRGGNTLLAGLFLHHLIGEIVPTNSIVLRVGNHEEFVERIQLIPSDHPGFKPLEDFQTYRPTKPIGDGHFVLSYNPADKIIQNEQLIILLTGRNTISAGEGFVDYVLNVENTLVIGQNTSGTMANNAGTFKNLPNSGFPVRFGDGVFFFPENTSQEGVGFAPDIWVIGDALEATLRMIYRKGMSNAEHPCS
jgi:hypothetical protein